jgi:hypothetical protein
MSTRTAGITKAIKRAKRSPKAPLSGKDRAAGEREENGNGPETGGGGWVAGEAVIVAAGDRALLRVACRLVKNAAKNADRLNNSLDIAKNAAGERANQADALIALLDEADSRKDVTVLPHLLRAAQIGISFEISKVRAAQKEQRELLAIDDTKGIDKRLLELERLARHLGLQGDLGLGDDEKDDLENEDD